jgi:hypothetical protein
VESFRSSAWKFPLEKWFKSPFVVAGGSGLNSNKQTNKMSSIPNLSSIHSGVPARLSNEAAAAKQKTYALKTLPTSVPRQSPLKLPPGVTRDVFDKAIDELRKVLGKDGVELNDKPLVDGWYMEHPFVILSRKISIKASS